MKPQDQQEQQQTPSQLEGLNFLRITSSELEPDDEALRTRILAIQPDVRYFHARPQDQDQKQARASKIMSVLEAALELITDDNFKKE
jgi:hypothetical protein